LPPLLPKLHRHENHFNALLAIQQGRHVGFKIKVWGFALLLHHVTNKFIAQDM
jgi:hypothetical protein